MHFNCAIQSPGHSHSRYTTSWLHLCMPQSPPTVHMAQMWGVCVSVDLLGCVLPERQQAQYLLQVLICI